MKIHSQFSLSYDEFENIKKIFRQSQCPNESLFHTFVRYRGLDEDGAILFDDEPRMLTTIFEADDYADKI